MGLQVNSQPQNFKGGVTIGDGVSAVQGLTVYGSISTSQYLYGDGSNLKNINAGNLQGFSGVTSVNGLTGAVSFIPTLTSSNNFTQVNTFGATTNFQSVTGTTATFNDFVSGSSNLLNVFGSKSKTDAVFSTVQGITGVGLSATSLTGTNGSFRSLTATNFYNSLGQELSSVYGTKGNADSVYNTVNTTSAYWEATRTKVTNSSASWDTAYTAVTSNSADWTIGKTLSTGADNTTGYRFVSNNPRIVGNLTVDGTVTALSGATFYNTTFTTTSALCVYAQMNSGAALYVGASGTGDIASFYDIDAGVEILHIGGANSSFKNVGIKTSNPNKTLTVSGDISASGEVYAGTVLYVGGSSTAALYGDKSKTDSVFNTVQGITGTGLSATSLTGVNGKFTALTATNIYNSSGTDLSNVYGSKTVLDSVSSTVQSITSTGLSATSLTAVNSRFTNLTATSGFYTGGLSAAYLYGNGSGLTGIITSGVLYTSGGTVTGTGTINTPNLSAQSLTGTTIFGTTLTATSGFYTGGLSAAYFVGNGGGLTNLPSTTPTNVLYTSGGTVTGTGTINTPNLSAQSLTANSLTATSISATKFYGNLLAGVSTKSSTFTLALSDAGSVIRIAPTTTTYVNLVSTVSFDVGTQTIIAQVSAGTVSVSAGAGVNLLSYSNKLTLGGQNSVASLIYTANNEWLLAGDIN